MANEQLTIAQNDARLTVIGKSWADVTTDSGDGITIDQLVIGEIEDITGLDLPDIGDGTRIIIGYDDSGDPWLYIDGLDDPYDLGDLDLDLLDLDFELGSSLVIGDLNVSVDDDLKIKEEELPTSIEIVTLPKKLRYVEGSRIDLSGMVVTAKKEDGSTWTSAKYPNGHIPLGELIIEPTHADMSQAEGTIYTDGEGVVAAAVYANVIETEKSISGYDTSACPDRSKPIPGDGVESFLGAWPDVPGVYLITNYNGTVLGKSLGGHIRACGCTKYVNLVYGNLYWFCSSGAELDSSRWSGIGGSGSAASLYAPVSTSNPSEAGELKPESYGQIISVSWPRYGDGELLSASFEIEVIPRGHGGGR